MAAVLQIINVTQPDDDQKIEMCHSNKTLHTKIQKCAVQTECRYLHTQYLIQMLI
jgi:hypothetical protein